MKFTLRFAAVLLPLSFTLTPCALAYVSSIDNNLPDAQALAQLELRAQQAGPRDQCFLYTELVHTIAMANQPAAVGATRRQGAEAGKTPARWRRPLRPVEV